MPNRKRKASGWDNIKRKSQKLLKDDAKTSRSLSEYFSQQTSGSKNPTSANASDIAQSDITSAPVSEEIQTAAQSAPVSEEIQTAAQSAPVSEVIQTAAQSAPVSEEIQTAAQSAPVSEVIQTAAQSVPVSEEIQTAASYVCIDDILGKTSSDEVKYALIKNREPPTHFQFPSKQYKDKRNPKGFVNRQCCRDWFQRFSFLSYSQKSHGLFCLACALFPPMSHRRASYLIDKPYNNWKDALTVIKSHSHCEYHITSMAKLQAFIKTFEDTSKRIDACISDESAIRVGQNREILRSLIKCIEFCGRQGIALRGHRDSSTSESANLGNFRALLSLRIDAGDDVLREHLVTCDKNASYTSNTSQNNFLFCIKDYIQNEIVAEITNQRFGPYFGVQCDEVTDSSNWEQLGIVVRYVKDNKPVERLLQFVPCKEITGEAICDKLVTSLRNVGLDISFCRSQTMDGAGNMAGHQKGCAALFRKQSPKAIYHHCSSHDLNLALSHSCKVREIQIMLDCVKQLGIFFHYSPKRSRRLEIEIDEWNDKNPGSPIKKSTFKVFCATRWVEKHSVLQDLVEMYVPIVETLEAIGANESGWDVKSSSDAFGLMKRLTDSTFIIALQTAIHFFRYTKGLSTKLQGRVLDVVEGYQMVQTVLTLFRDIRSTDGEFENIFLNAEQMAQSTGSVIELPRRCPKQAHRNNVPAEDVKLYFQRAVSLPFVDNLIEQLSLRFSSLAFKAVLGLKLISGVQLSNEDKSEIHSFYKDDLEEQSSFHQEVSLWEHMWRQEGNQPQTISATLSHPKTCPLMFPNITKILHLLLMTSVTSAEVERGNSSLRYIKNVFRSTMSEDRFNSLILMFVHKDISLDTERIIDMYSQRHPRKMMLHNPLS
jgi:hypothetical protein